MGFFDKIKKNVEIRHASVDPKTNQMAQEKISILEKKIEEAPDNFDLHYQMYCCYVDLSKSWKKIECLEKMHQLRPNDAFPLSQLAHIYYSEVENPEKGKFYQNKANKVNSNKFL